MGVHLKCQYEGEGEQNILLQLIQEKIRDGGKEEQHMRYSNRQKKQFFKSKVETNRQKQDREAG